MGVPAFFRWLSRKYPTIVTNAIEEKPREVHGTTVPVDTTQPNPNGVEFDNLYLDMNGIIHPCTHPEDKAQPRNEDEMMIAIFEYIDRIFRIIRPRKLLYLAVDGVAPRAKMNQQRSRRFRAAKENAEKQEAIENVRQELERQGLPVPPPKSEEEHFDSNVITPGTSFMSNLSVALRYYIHERLNNDPGWKNIQVILSDANVPGEGEHKIMDFIRRQRACPSHNPNIHHVLCGADADLIMLGLATHEPYFTIVREEFNPHAQNFKPCELCGQYDHELKQCQGLPQNEFDTYKAMPNREKEFIFIRLTVLREYLQRELTIPNLPFKFDFERAIDDWVFMCFFVGNDFLPHLPSLEIREGAIDRLIGLYKKAIYRTGGYLTEDGRVDFGRVQVILTELGEQEDEIFKMRQIEDAKQKQREKDRRKRMKGSSAPAFVPEGHFAPVPLGRGIRPEPLVRGRQEAAQMRMHTSASADGSKESSVNEANRIAAKDLRRSLMGNDSANERRGAKRKHDEVEEDDEEDEGPKDAIRLGDEGWKERYYQAKFEVSANDTKFRYRVARAYAEGLCWVLLYYYQGCPSWKWFYPYHYAPFASDFVNLGDFRIDFEKAIPFLPLEQLMGVFPAASRRHLPAKYADLMVDPDSPIIDFYPKDFVVDLNGKRYAWQGVALLPFVEESRLLDALDLVQPTLTLEEKSRNVTGHDRIYVRRGHKAFDFFVHCYDSGVSKTDWIELDPALTYGMSGTIRPDDDDKRVLPNDEVISPLEKCSNIRGNQAIGVQFCDANFAADFTFPAKRLPGAKTPPPTLKPAEWDDRRPYRPQIGFSRDVPRAGLGPAGHRMIGHNFDHRPPYRPRHPPPLPSFSSDSYSVPPVRYNNPQRDEYSGYSGNYQQHAGGSNVAWQSAMRNQAAAYQQQQQNYYQHQQMPRGGHWGAPRSDSGNGMPNRTVSAQTWAQYKEQQQQYQGRRY